VVQIKLMSLTWGYTGLPLACRMHTNVHLTYNASTDRNLPDRQVPIFDIASIAIYSTTLNLIVILTCTRRGPPGTTGAYGGASSMWTR